MNECMELLLRSVFVGAGATAAMDLWAALLRRFAIPSLDFAMLGRWVGHLRHGTFFHDHIAAASPIRHERPLGWAAHYGIGIGFAGLLHTIFGLEWARDPSLFPALAIGVGTVFAPLLILQPALGAGIASRRTPKPVFNSLKSLATHVVFGFGLYLSASVLARSLSLFH